MSIDIGSTKVPHEGIEAGALARVLQSADDMERAILYEFAWYVENPAAYRTGEEQGTFRKGSAEDYAHLWQQGVRLKDLERIAEIATTEAASLEDVQSQSKDTPALKVFLIALRWWEQQAAAELASAHEDAVATIDLSLVRSGAAPVITHDDQDIATYEALWMKYERLRSAREHAERIVSNQTQKT
jgi:hypothetical protein